MTLDQTGGGVPQARVVLHSVDENADSTTPLISELRVWSIASRKTHLYASKDGFFSRPVTVLELGGAAQPGAGRA